MKQKFRPFLKNKYHKFSSAVLLVLLGLRNSTFFIYRINDERRCRNCTSAFLRSRGGEKMQYRQKHIRAHSTTADYAPQCRAEPPEDVGCTKFAQGRDCPYPRHGFIYWQSENTCLRTRMDKINGSKIGGT